MALGLATDDAIRPITCPLTQRPSSLTKNATRLAMSAATSARPASPTYRQPVHPSSANAMSSRPANRASQARRSCRPGRSGRASPAQLLYPGHGQGPLVARFLYRVWLRPLVPSTIMMLAFTIRPAAALCSAMRAKEAPCCSLRAPTRIRFWVRSGRS
jgi:hypothetical protein